jgi:hypothetical protein
VKKRHFFKFVAAWLIAWLPLSGAMASVMPIYGSAGALKVAAASVDAVAPDDALSAMPCHAVKDQAIDAAEGKSPKTSSCPHCVLCHIAGSIVPPTMPMVPMSNSHDCPQSLGVVTFTSFVPPLLQRPPSDPRAA